MKKLQLVVFIALLGVQACAFAKPLLGCASGTTQYVTIDNELENPTLSPNSSPALTQTAVNVNFYQSNGNFCWGPVTIPYGSEPVSVCGGGSNGCANIASIRIYPSQVLNNTNWGVNSNNQPYTNYAYTGSPQSPYSITINPASTYTNIKISQDNTQPAPAFDPQSGMVSTQGSMTATSDTSN